MKTVCTGAFLANWWKPEIKRLFVLIGSSVAVMTLLVHGFLFSNELFSHDSLGFGYYFDPGTVSYYTSLGRFFIPVYEQIKGITTAPIVIGILFTLWITLTAFLIIRLLDIRSNKGIVFTSALLCSNLAMVLTGASYLYCMDEYAFALFTAVGAAYLFAKGGWWSIPGLALLVISAGMYQAYFITAACICMLVVVKDVVENQKCGRVFLKGVRYIILLIVGFVLYYVTWRGLCVLREVAMARTNESVLSSGFGSIIDLVFNAGIKYVSAMLRNHGVLTGWMTVVHVGILILLAGRLLTLFADRELHLSNKILLAALVAIMPIAFNAAQILFPASATRLTNFTWEFPYLLLVLSMEKGGCNPCQNRIRTVALILLCSVLWHHTIYANHVYLKKDLEKNATIALAARMIDRIELLEGYTPGETKVAFVGMLTANPYLSHRRPEFTTVDSEVGLWGQYAVTYSMSAYITSYLNYPLLVDLTDYSTIPEVQEMPCFPAAKSVQMINGTVVVKLS